MPAPEKEKVVIVGVGNKDRGDDGAGSYLVDLLEQELNPESVDPRYAIWIIDAGGVPDEFTQDIVDYKPTKITIVDAAVMREIPGTIRRISIDLIPESSLSTHQLSLRVIAGLWQKLTGTEIEFIGIEPKNVEFGAKMSDEVKAAVEQVKEEIISVLRDTSQSN